MWYNTKSSLYNADSSPNIDSSLDLNLQKYRLKSRDESLNQLCTTNSVWHQSTTYLLKIIDFRDENSAQKEVHIYQNFIILCTKSGLVEHTLSKRQMSLKFSRHTDIKEQIAFSFYLLLLFHKWDLETGLKYTYVNVFYLIEKEGFFSILRHFGHRARQP